MLQVEVASYLEGQVLFTKDLTLQGQTGTEVVRMGVDTGSSGDARGWFVVADGVDLEVRNLTFDGNGHLVYQGFRHKGTGRFENVAFRDIQYQPEGPAFQGIAIVSFNGGQLEVVNCSFESIGRAGVLAFTSGSAATPTLIEGMTYTGKGDGAHLDYGLEINAGSHVVVHHSTFTDCFGQLAGEGVAAGSAAITVLNSSGSGTTATVESNTLLRNREGLRADFVATDPTVDLTAHFNRIVGNGKAMVSMISPVDGEHNWWGCNEGPDSGPDCDTTAGPVDADPWQILRIDADPDTIPVAGTSTLTADLITDSEGADTTALGLMAEVELTFSATLGTVPPLVTTTGNIATPTYTAGLVMGIGSASVSLDNEEVATPVTIAGIVSNNVLEIPTLDGVGLVVLVLLLAVMALGRLRSV